MENNELQKIWKNVDMEINQSSKEELNLLLTSKTRQTINKFLVIISISILVSLGLLVYLTVTSLNRQNDLIYLINNITLGIVTIISLLSGLVSWYRLYNNQYCQPLKNWLEVRISHLDKWLNGRFSKSYIILIPFLCVLTVLSIHVYFENKLFTEVLKTPESIISLIVAIPISIFVAYFGVRKIRKYQLNNLEFLKDLYGRLCNVN
jgi:H+/gluconate symporter-like permease